MNTTAWACGIRLTVSSGSAPTALRPGVSRMTRPCLSKRWGRLMMAWRHRAPRPCPAHPSDGLSSGLSSCQKPMARASSTLTLRTCATFRKRTRNLVGIPYVAGHLDPALGLEPPFGQTLHLQAGFNGQKAQAMGHLGS